MISTILIPFQHLILIIIIKAISISPTYSDSHRNYHNQPTQHTCQFLLFISHIYSHVGEIQSETIYIKRTANTQKKTSMIYRPAKEKEREKKTRTHTQTHTHALTRSFTLLMLGKFMKKTSSSSSPHHQHQTNFTQIMV